MLIKVSSKLTRLQPYSRGQARKFHERVRSSSRHVTGSSAQRVAGATRVHHAKTSTTSGHHAAVLDASTESQTAVGLKWLLFLRVKKNWMLDWS